MYFAVKYSNSVFFFVWRPIQVSFIILRMLTPDSLFFFFFLIYFWFISWNNVELSICSCRHIIVAGRKENIWLFSCSSFSFLLVFPFWKKSYILNCPTSISGFSNPFWSRLSTSYHVGNITINYIFVWLNKIYNLTKYFNSSIYDKNSVLYSPEASVHENERNFHWSTIDFCFTVWCNSHLKVPSVQSRLSPY